MAIILLIKNEKGKFTVAKYRKKPVVIEAFQYTRDNIHNLMNWIEGFGNKSHEVLDYNPNRNEYEVKTLEGNHLMTKGCYVIRGVQGEFYPCKQDIFEQTYEKVN